MRGVRSSRGAGEPGGESGDGVVRASYTAGGSGKGCEGSGPGGAPGIDGPVANCTDDPGKHPGHGGDERGTDCVAYSGCVDAGDPGGDGVGPPADATS